MEIVTINGGMLVVKGVPEGLKEISFFGLNPKEKVKRIGKQSSSCSRETTFKTFVTYEGVLKIGDQDHMIFRVPADQVLGFDLFKAVEPVFIPYRIVEWEDVQELILDDYENSTKKIHKAIFDIVK